MTNKAKIRELVAKIADYKGEGPMTTPWQEIVKDLGAWAREALALLSAEERPSPGDHSRAVGADGRFYSTKA